MERVYSATQDAIFVFRMLINVEVYIYISLMSSTERDARKKAIMKINAHVI